MKRINILLIVILSSLVSLNGYSQTKKADKLFKYYNYAEAIPLYQKVIESENNTKRVHATQQLAACYRFTNNMAEARIWYEKAIEINQTNSMNYYYLGQALRTLGLYQSAADAFNTFNELAPDSLNGKKYYQFCVDIQEWENLPDVAEIKNIETINTKYSDFGPALYNDKIVFTSDRKLDPLDKNTYGWTNFNYLNLFITKPEYYNSFWNGVPEAEQMSSNFNQTYHDGPACFTSNNKVYVTKTVAGKGKKGTDKIRTHLMKIFYADIVEGKKLRYDPFFYNSDSYSVEHPTLSKTNDQMIFSSDMPGGFGGTDLYISTLKNGKWSIPENLGENINSNGNEVFPYWVNESILLFSSDGHLGFGGLDIYQTKLENDVWGKPENLKLPLNSSYDDFGVLMLENRTEGMLSSNRPGGKGSDDIYAFKMFKKANSPKLVVVPGLMASGYVKDFVSKEPINEATVFLFNPATDNVLVLKTDSFGYYETTIAYDNPYVVKAMKESYIYDCSTFRTPDNMAIEKYSIPRDLLLAKLEINQVFKVENIYYDLDKWFIRKDAEEPLDNLVRIMREYPITAELSSHTDSRATHEYNNELSQKRAESAVRYIVLQGISQGRITAKGYGETQLVNKCADGVFCTEAQHQANRRTEFKITGIDASLVGQDPFNLKVFKVGDVISAKLLDANFFTNCLVEKESLQDYLVPGKAQKNIEPAKNNNAAIIQVEEPKPAVVKEMAAGPVYRIQLVATPKKLDIPTYFSNISNLVDEYGISVQKVNNLNKYQLGNFSTKGETVSLRKVLENKGYKGCFPVMVEN